MFVHRRRQSFGIFGIFLALFFSQVPGAAKLIPRRDPVDGALDATVIVIMRQESQDTFRVEEVFLGSVQKGQTLALPGFKLVVEDTSAFIAGIDRIEPIYANTGILVFLKPAANALRGSQRFGDLAIAGFGNCYFWSHVS